MKRYIKSSLGRYDDYFGQTAFNMYGDKVWKALKGKKISKSVAKADAPGGLRYEAEQLDMDLYDLLETLEGMCANGTAMEIDDSTYEVLETPVKTWRYWE